MASLVYFLSAQSIMNDYKKQKEVDQAVKEIMEDHENSLFEPIEKLEEAVAQDLAALDAKYKNLN